MNCVWDPRKNLRNVRLHGIAFEDSVQIFEGPTLEKTDDRFDYGETRVYAIGMTNGLEVTVLYRHFRNGTKDHFSLEVGET